MQMGVESEASTQATQEEDICIMQMGVESEASTQAAVLSSRIFPMVELIGIFQEQSSQNLVDESCDMLTRETEVLTGQLKSTREALGKCKGSNKQLKRKVNRLAYKIEELESKGVTSDSCNIFEESVIEGAPTSDQEDGDEEDDEEDNETIEEEPDFSLCFQMMIRSVRVQRIQTLKIEETETKGESIPLSSNHNIRTEPKYIVFLSKLLPTIPVLPFSVVLKANSKVTATQIGTEVVIKTVCTNPGCGKEFTWHSQPLVPGTKAPAGNFLICMAVLFAGGSFSKVAHLPAYGPGLPVIKYILQVPTGE
ncbi:hypothetical protein OS493_037744 [Desmophyllum pertusum]|uniref:Uncharacterized protein n=1 Tax=Desmophyllum pertusum TaxID=174260 RepID=A0A9W9YA99_9CNID|nr:hypothetical protein OS493_037744 [Desmophyllum pertusum]